MEKKLVGTLSADDIISETVVAEDEEENVMKKEEGVWTWKVCGKTTGRQKTNLIRIMLEFTCSQEKRPAIYVDMCSKTNSRRIATRRNAHFQDFKRTPFLA